MDRAADKEGTLYADIVPDISHRDLDRTFQYHIPEGMEGIVTPGTWVEVPFGNGNSVRRGLVLKLSGTPKISPERIKDILRVPDTAVTTEDNLIRLAVWMSREYGGTLIQSLHTVMPVKKKVKEEREAALLPGPNYSEYRELAGKKNWKARLRVLEALEQQSAVDVSDAKKELGLTAAVLRAMVEAGAVTVDSSRSYRGSISTQASLPEPQLTEEQEKAVSTILSGFAADDRRPVLLHGITGSGKTEIYMKLIRDVIDKGRQVIVLIPEISLTHQAIERYCGRFGDRVSMINSRLSEGERSDQFERAENGDVSIMLGPRSALFTPFPSLGLIIVDEEHDNAYQSETVPRYHAGETARKLAELTGAFILYGSATPSLESYYKAQKGEYRLVTLNQRAVPGSMLPQTMVVDMREELAGGNRSVFSRLLREKMEKALEENRQVMLFLNRRGFSRTVSCRSCGEPVGCPHCAVSLTEHAGRKLVCHYCGYTRYMPQACPKCGSPYIAGFGLGTERVEMITAQQFPKARILRMDQDTTAGKHGHEKILEQFEKKEADILIGTQMIVKGHDFPGVALVGILAADMSLYMPDFRSMEKTFQLLTQASGRAGRGADPGEVVIQTYSPENYSIMAAAKADYTAFYERELLFRSQLSYPPCGEMCEILVTSGDEAAAQACIREAASLLQQRFRGTINLIGPADAPVARIKDMWRKHLFFSAGRHDIFVEAISMMQSLSQDVRAEKIYLSISRQ